MRVGAESVAVDRATPNMDTTAINQNRILCTNLTELVKKTLLSFCEINITFTSHLEIFGSVHVHADGDDVISFLLNEKCAKHVTGPKNVVHRRSWSDTMGVVKSQSVATEQFLENVADDYVRFDEDKVSSSAGREQKVHSSPDVVTAITPENEHIRSDESPVRRESKTDVDDDVEIVDARVNVIDGGDGEVAMPISHPMYPHASPEDGNASWMHPWVRPTHLIPNWSAVSNQPRWPSSATHGSQIRSLGKVRQSNVSVDYVPSVVTLQDDCLPQEELISAVEVKSVLRSLAGNPDASCCSSSLDDPLLNVPITHANIKQEQNAQGQATSQAYGADVATTAASHTASTTTDTATLWGGKAGDATGMWQASTDDTGGIGDHGGRGAGDGETSTILKHPCFLCSLSFHSQLRLKMHLSRWHRQIVSSPGGEVRCLICHKVYADSGAFSAHASHCHYRCVACGKSFSSKQAHDLHFRADHQLVRYQCQVCAVRFKTKDGFRCHMNAQHNRSRQYDCLTCGRRFYTRQALYSHKKQNHP